jgi:hypothetical protein
MAGYAQNQLRKAVFMAEFMHEMEFDMETVWDADEKTRKLVSAAAAERMNLKTGRPKIDANTISLRGVRLPSEDTWAMACQELQHRYDEARKDAFSSLYAVEPR